MIFARKEGKVDSFLKHLYAHGNHGKLIRMTTESETTMNKIKIIFFDIDGTLIDMQKKEITERTVETLRRLQEHGILLCIATGRTPMTVPRFEGVAFDAFLTFNGSYCYNQKEDIYANPIPVEDVKQLLANAAAMNRPVSIATRNRIAANGKDKDLADYFAIAKEEVVVADDFEQVAQEEVYQMMLGCIGEERVRLLEGVKNAKLAAWWDRAVDVIPGDSGKGIGVEQLLRYYHLDQSEAMAFGDGNNDIEMLQAVGAGVAMENASPELKAVATEICGHVAEDGVYHYCLEHGFI